MKLGDRVLILVSLSLFALLLMYGFVYGIYMLTTIKNMSLEDATYQFENRKRMRPMIGAVALCDIALYLTVFNNLFIPLALFPILGVNMFFVLIAVYGFISSKLAEKRLKVLANREDIVE